jgi:DNA-binding IclR family transcriptional regulator
MQLLADATGETVHLGTLIDSEIIYVHKVDSRHMLGMYSRVGRRAPLALHRHRQGADGLGDPERRAMILQGLQSSPNTAKKPLWSPPPLPRNWSGSRNRGLAKTVKSLTTTSAAWVFPSLTD